MKPSDARESIVYMAVNLVNGKKYIGITCDYLSRRKSKHYFSAKKGANTLIAKAIRKYGIDSIRFDVLSEWPTYSQAKDEEIRLIAALKPEYNLTAGGDGALGYKHSKEARELMSRLHKGRPGYWKGKKLPQHVVDNMKRVQAARTDKKRVLALGPIKSRKKVVCLDDGQIFASVSEAAKFYGIANSSISNVCLGAIKMAKGLVFRFLTKRGDPEEPEVARKKAKSSKGHRVVCLNDGKMFDSCMEASLFYGVSSSSISATCHRSFKRMTAGGKVFRFFGDHHGGVDEATSIKMLAKQSQKRGLGPNYRKGVVCLNDDMRFETVKSCAEYYGLGQETVIKSCRGRHKRGSFSGLSFAYEVSP